MSLVACGGSGNGPQATVGEAEASVPQAGDETAVFQPAPTVIEAAAGDQTTTSSSSSSSSVADSPASENNVNTNYSYPIVDTDQNWCFSDSAVITCGEAFNGQDGQYSGLQPAYQDNGDSTITDLNTGLMWIQDAGDKTFYADAMAELENYSFAGYDDWRLPTIKELYSLALFSGVDASSASSSNVEGLQPFIDDAFVFLYGDESGSARVIDAQWLTSSIYNSTVMGNESCFFGFNFSDGRIKCYPLKEKPNGGYFAQYVRGGNNYGSNDYIQNSNNTITDNATGLSWTQNDNGAAIDWNGALNYCESLSLDGSDAWRLPNIKELHSIVDYGRSPDITNSAAIDPLFNLTSITNEAGASDYGFYWSSTTLISYPDRVSTATYISFGRALGYMEEFGGWVDVHGAGAQRSDPKVSTGETFEFGQGPQGDARRVNNYVLCVSGGVAESSSGSSSTISLSGSEELPPEGGEAPAAGEAGSQQGPPAGGEPNFAAAAATLGVTEQEIKDALGGPPPNFEAAAATLGVTVEELQSALNNQ
ncbi:MAG: DUF1566 domain-containing protein [Chloroflexi bacterium]|nr:DUF1566 domain-containing protein [Chloroflexota bacterium]